MKTHRYIENGFVLEDGLEDEGKGDALLRTMYYSKTKKLSGFDEQIKAFDACTVNSTETNGILRHPDLKNNDTSMDAMIGWIIFTKRKLPYYSFREIVSGLPRQISDKYRWSSSWWSWVQSLSGKTRGWWFLISTIFMGMAYWSNWPLKWLGITDGKKYFHFFNVHLAAWMLYTMESGGILKWLAKASLAIATPKSNALVRKLLGWGYNGEQMYSAKGWKWERLPWVKYHGIDNSEITPEKAGITLDIDIIKYIS